MKNQRTMKEQMIELYTGKSIEEIEANNEFIKNLMKSKETI